MSKSVFNKIAAGTMVLQSIQNYKLDSIKVGCILVDSIDNVLNIGKENLNVKSHIVTSGENNGIGYARISINAFKAMKNDHILRANLRELIQGMEYLMVMFSPHGATGTAFFSYFLDFITDEALNAENIVFAMILSGTGDETSEKKQYSLLKEFETDERIKKLNLLVIRDEMIEELFYNFTPQIYKLICSSLCNTEVDRLKSERPYIIVEQKTSTISDIMEKYFEAALNCIIESFRFACEGDKNVVDRNQTRIYDEYKLIISNTDLKENELNPHNFNKSEDFIENVRRKVYEKYLKATNGFYKFKESLVENLSVNGFDNTQIIINRIKEDLKTTSSSEKDTFLLTRISSYWSQEKSFINKAINTLKGSIIRLVEISRELDQIIREKVASALLKEIEQFEKLFLEPIAPELVFPESLTKEVVSAVDVNFFFNEVYRKNRINDILIENKTLLIRHHLLYGVDTNYKIGISRSAKNREGAIVISEDLAKSDSRVQDEFMRQFQKVKNLIRPRSLQIVKSEDEIMSGKISITSFIACYKNELEAYNRLLTKQNDKINDVKNETTQPIYNSIRDWADLFPVRLRWNGSPEPEDIELTFLYLVLTPHSSIFRKKNFLVRTINKEFKSIGELNSITLAEENIIRRNFYEYAIENLEEVIEQLQEILVEPLRVESIKKNTYKFTGPIKLKYTVAVLLGRVKYIQETFVNEKVL